MPCVWRNNGGDTGRGHRHRRHPPGTQTRRRLLDTRSDSLEYNIESYSWTNSDAFVIGFRTTATDRAADDWSLYEIRLSEQSVRRIYQHPPHDLPTGYYWRKPALTAKSVANGTAALAFTGWPVSPGNDAVINLIAPGSEVIPLAEVPDDFFILDAS